jgi:hypothetical protein
VRATSDIQQLEPMVSQCVDNGCKPQRVLVDTGYENIRQIREVARNFGVKTLCPPARIANARDDQPGGRPHRRISKRLRRRMRAQLNTKRGRQLYRLRGTTVEPAVGIIKSALGFRQFSLRAWQTSEPNGRSWRWHLTASGWPAESGLSREARAEGLGVKREAQGLFHPWSELKSRKTDSKTQNALESSLATWFQKPSPTGSWRPAVRLPLPYPWGF